MVVRGLAAKSRLPVRSNPSSDVPAVPPLGVPAFATLEGGPVWDASPSLAHVLLLREAVLVLLFVQSSMARRIFTGSPSNRRTVKSHNSASSS